MTSSSEQTTALHEGHSALECVSDWLYEDSHGFVIPDTEWGREIYSALREVVEAARPRVVSTATELESLPRESVLISSTGTGPYRKTDEGWVSHFSGPYTSDLMVEPALVSQPLTVLWVGGTE